MSAKSNQLAIADAKLDQSLADVRDGAIEDIPAWAELGRKINAAADTRVKCAAEQWTNEEMYRLVRLADVGHRIVTARLIGRKV